MTTPKLKEWSISQFPCACTLCAVWRQCRAGPDCPPEGKWIFTRLDQRGDHSVRGYHADIHSRDRIPLRMSTKNDILKILCRNFDFSIKKRFYVISIVLSLGFLRILSAFHGRGCASLLIFEGKCYRNNVILFRDRKI